MELRRGEKADATTFDAEANIRDVKAAFPIMQTTSETKSVAKKHPAKDFLRATKDARASRLAGMLAMTSIPSIDRENQDLQSVGIRAAIEGASADKIKGQMEAATSIPLPFGDLRSKLAEMMARAR